MGRNKNKQHNQSRKKIELVEMVVDDCIRVYDHFEQYLLL